MPEDKKPTQAEAGKAKADALGGDAKAEPVKPVVAGKPTPTQAEADDIKADALNIDPKEAKKDKAAVDREAKRAAARQAVAKPEPSQEECDKMLQASTGFPYKTR